ncbi:hypothetical protein [Streptomyces fulvoviolaceus]|uniref:hypothetical protein n=1 Tax=Streptomyces fulvoviolaceus TaxID=285535 RepID=UPI0005BD3ACF|nr:hypothetical protein [Streptomyces fulvoviolaceus]MCT9084615.1 hypothetical protein [Streptomyces fulvoviolaceus]
MEAAERFVNAAGDGEPAVVERMLGDGVDADADDIHRRTALAAAVRAGHAGVVGPLLDAGRIRGSGWASTGR